MNKAFLKGKDLAVYGCATLVCGGLTYILLELWRAELHIPFVYKGGDELPICMWIKGLKDNPWIFRNSRLGMPFGMELFDYPLPESFHLLIFKLLGFTTRHVGKILNLFYLATYPAVLLTSLYSCRRLGLGYPAALFTSFLYTFLPFHFRRGEPHLFLAAYYTVPLILLVMFRLSSAEPMFFGTNWRARENLRPRFRRTWGIILICAILGSSGIGYYSFFACFLLVIAGATAALYRQRIAPMLNAMVIVVLITLTVALNIAPNLLYGRTETAARPAPDAETFGLKIAQLLLPMNGHRLPLFAEVKARYNNAPLVNENDAATMGLAGSTGLLFLLGWIGYRLMRPGPQWLAERKRELLDQGALLALAATLLGTIGGFGSLFAFLVHPQVRSYNRISIYIAFICLFALGLLVDTLWQKRVRTARQRLVCGGFLSLLLLAGILDQTTPLLVPDYHAAKASFKQDEKFIQTVEAVTPVNSMIFQLPYMQFPEAGARHKLLNYDPARAYIHSEMLRWSYGAMKDGAGDAWQSLVTSLPLFDFVQVLVAAGFAGIYVDRFGYPDYGLEVERDLSKILGEGFLVANTRMVFFALDHYKAALRSQMSDRQWQEYIDKFTPPFIVYESGFYREDVSPGRVWRWSRAKSSLRIFNLSSKPKPVVIEVAIASGHDEFSDLQITSPVLNKVLRINRAGSHLRERLVLPVGQTEIKFSSAASRVHTPGDKRRLFFAIENLTLKDLPQSP